MSKWIVVTSINKPTESLIQLNKIEDWNLVVVGDKKSPSNWNLPGCIYLDIEKQKSLGFKISKYLPYNHYARKNIGYLYAIKKQASLIYETDDDNILLNSKPHLLELNDSVKHLETNKKFANIYHHFTNKKIWPRGFPLDEINKIDNFKYSDKKRTFIPIQQALANREPDVDAIYRLVIDKKINFNINTEPIALPRGTFCPFNSQNTLWYKTAFWGLLLFSSVSSRVCDILRSYWVQRLLWELDGNLVFLPPSVLQRRNVHNLIKDFEEEIQLYLKVKSLCDSLLKLQFKSDDTIDKLIVIAEELLKNDFIKEIDVKLAKAWIQDLRECGYKNI